MRIIGAGAAGLIAANMLRRHKPVVYERGLALPDNHAAVLRFRTENVSRVTGIPFKKVVVYKAIKNPFNGLVQSEASLQLSNMYALKVTGRVIPRSVFSLEPAERWIAPVNFLEQLAVSVDIRFGWEVSMGIANPQLAADPVISTMPMPSLMKQLAWEPEPEFNYWPISVITAEYVEPEVDVYQTIYYPGRNHYGVYRASITGNRLIIEVLGLEELSMTDLGPVIAIISEDFGIRAVKNAAVKIKYQKFGKIAPIDDGVRKSFMFWASEQHHIYSLGRFATWRQILLDDIIKDVQFIDGFIAHRDLYSVQKTMLG